MSLPLVSDDMNGQTPWYIKFLYTFGLPAAIAVYLVNFVVDGVDSKLDSMNSAVSSNQENIIQSRKEHDNLQLQIGTTNQILQRICVNTASNQNERNACFPGQR